MPNRILKESICTSDTIDKLSDFEETFFCRLIVNCDDYGVMDARPSILKSRLYPLKDARYEKKMQPALDKLSSIGLVCVYWYDGRPYLQMLTWADHQRLRNSKKKYPHPEDCGELPQVAADCGLTRAGAESNPIPIQSESESESESNTAARVADFASFWSAYPKKVSKQSAQKAWDKLKPDDALLATMLSAIEAQTKEKASLLVNKQFCPEWPYPASWLNGRRWEDETAQNSEPPKNDPHTERI